MAKFELFAATVFNPQLIGPLFKKAGLAIQSERETLNKLCVLHKTSHPATMQHYAFQANISDDERRELREHTTLVIIDFNKTIVIFGSLFQWKQAIEHTKILAEVEVFLRTTHPLIWTATHGPLRISS